MKHCSFILVACLAFPVFAHNKADKEDTRVTSIVDSVFYGSRGFKNNKDIVGASVGIYWKGKIYTFNYGLADREQHIPVSNETLFEIGSNTKVFTGLLLADEIVNGKVTGQTFIDSFVPVNKHIRNRIRLIDLADYTSGLPSLHDSASLAELEKTDSVHPLDLVTDEYLLKTVASTEDLPGYGHYEYNNFSFGLLGYILCRMNSMPYDALVRNRIFMPLAMRHSYAGKDSTNMPLARGYKDGAREPFLGISGLAGAGIIKSDINDMMQFIKYQVDGGSSIDNVLSVAAKPYHNEPDMEMKTALGWHIGRKYGGDYYMMRGDTYGASSAMAFSRDKKFGLVILLNCASSSLTQSLASRLQVRIVEGDPEFVQAYRSMREVKVDRKILESYEGNYSLADMKMHVTVSGDQLYIQLAGQEKEQVKAVSDRMFNSREVIASFEFKVNKNGKTEKLVLHQNGQELPFVRE